MTVIVSWRSLKLVSTITRCSGGQKLASSPKKPRPSTPLTAALEASFIFKTRRLCRRPRCLSRLVGPRLVEIKILMNVQKDTQCSAVARK